MSQQLIYGEKITLKGDQIEIDGPCKEIILPCSVSGGFIKANCCQLTLNKVGNQVILSFQPFYANTSLTGTVTNDNIPLTLSSAIPVEYRSNNLNHLPIDITIVNNVTSGLFTLSINLTNGEVKILKMNGGFIAAGSVFTCNNSTVASWIIR